MTEIRNVPRGAAAKILDEAPGATIVSAADEDLAALRSERDRLTARIAEIDAILGVAK